MDSIGVAPSRSEARCVHRWPRQAAARVHSRATPSSHARDGSAGSSDPPGARKSLPRNALSNVPRAVARLPWHVAGSHDAHASLLPRHERHETTTMPSCIASARRALLLAAIATLAACSSDQGTAPTNTPPVGQPQDTTKLPPAGSVQAIQLGGDREVVHTYMGWLQAHPQDAAGRPVTAAVTWRSSDANVVSVDVGGAMIGRNPGKATITASAGGRSAAIEVTVAPRRVTTFDGSYPLVTLHRDEVAFFGVTALDQKGQWIHEPQVVFTSADPSIVEVNSRGDLIPRRAGETRVTATADGVSISRIVKVAAETTYPIKYANGNALPWVIMETTVEEGEGTLTSRLVMTEASFTLSNTSDTWSQRTVVEEYRISDIGGNRIVSRVGTHVSTSSGAFQRDAATGRLHLTVNGDPAARLEAWYDESNVRKLRVYGHPANGENAFLHDYQR